MNKPTLVHDVNAEQETKQQEQTVKTDIFDNLESLRLTQDFQKTAGVKKLLTTIPVRKPNPQAFIRVHSDPAYRGAFAVIELKEDQEVYLLPPNVAKSLPGEFVMVMLYTAITRQGNLFVWHHRLPGEDGKTIEWWRSAAECAELAMENWIRVIPNKEIGAYDPITPTLNEGETIPEPTWPDLTFKEILRIAFKARIILDPNTHPVVKRLRGGK